MRTLLIIILLTFDLTLYSQVDSTQVDKKNYDSYLLILNDSTDYQISLGCSFGGTTSDNVKALGVLIMDSQYDLIKRLLKSKSPATQYLVVITCDILSEKNKISLTPKDIDLINKIRQSDKEIWVCSGCTFRGTYPIKGQLRNDDFLYSMTANWLKTKYIEINNKR
jgi:hypothetical protein